MSFWEWVSALIAGTGMISVGVGVSWWVRRMGWFGWWDSEHGRFMMLLSASLLGLFFLVLTRGAWVGLLRQIFAVMVYLGFLGLTLWLPRLVWISQERERENMGFWNRVKQFFLRREPALWMASLQAILAAIVGFKFDWLTAEQAGLWVAGMNAILGAVVAWRTRPIAPTVFTTAFSVVLTLLAAYGLQVDQDVVATTNMVIVSVATFLARGQISPKEDAAKTGVLGAKPKDPVRT